MVDRAAHGAVTDYFGFGDRFPPHTIPFNIADLGLGVGMVIAVALLVRSVWAPSGLEQEFGPVSVGRPIAGE